MKVESGAIAVYHIALDYVHNEIDTLLSISKMFANSGHKDKAKIVADAIIDLCRVFDENT